MPKIYLSLTACAWLACAVLTYTLGYEGSFLQLNGLHSAAGDVVFPHLTHLGDSLILSSLIVLLFWRTEPAATTAGVAAIAVSGLLAVALKHSFFSDWHRPLTYFDKALVHHWPNVTEFFYTFPSGHSATAGAGFLTVAFVWRRVRAAQILTALSGVGVTYSRVYLGSHFPADVLAGNVLGTATTLLFLTLFYPKLSDYFKQLDVLTQVRLKTVLLVVSTFALVMGLWNRLG